MRMVRVAGMFDGACVVEKLIVSEDYISLECDMVV